MSAPEIKKGEWGYLDLAASGLVEVGEVDFSDGNYVFDYTRLWLHSESGRFWMADDAGCSCPSPFEDLTSAGLTEVPRLQVLIDHLEKRKSEVHEWNANELPRITDECSRLITAYRTKKKELNS